MATPPTGRPDGQPTKYKPEYCQQLIAHMAKGFSFESFAADCRVSFETLYEWARVHPEFSEAKKQGKSLELKMWESMATAGSAGKIKNFNSTAMIFSMKNKFPKLYRDQIKLDATIEIEGLAVLSEEDKISLIQKVLENKLKKANKDSSDDGK